VYPYTPRDEEDMVTLRLRRRGWSSLLFLCFLTVYAGFTHLFLGGSRLQPLPLPDWDSRVARVHAACSLSTVSSLSSLPPPPILGREGVAEKAKLHFLKLHQKQILEPLVRVAELGLDWCLVPKVASSSVCQAILPFLPQSSHPKAGQAPYSFIQKEVWERAGHLQWEDYSSSHLPAFLITRHPLARVASAYRNKLEKRTRSHDGEYFYKTYSSQIIRHSRGSWTAKDPEPTFNEFVTWLLGEQVSRYDEHWMPVSLRCRVCQLQYSHIVKYEYLDTEWPQLLASLDLTMETMEALQLPWRNRGHQGTQLKSYYTNISGTTMQQLYSRFEADFLMFGYRMEDDF